MKGRNGGGRRSYNSGVSRNATNNVSSLKAAQDRLDTSIEGKRGAWKRSLGETNESFLEINKTLTELQAKVQKATGRGGVGGIDDLQNQVNQLGNRSKQATHELRQQNKAMREAQWFSNGLNSSLKHLITSYLGLFAAVEGVRSLYHAGKEMDSLQASMLASSENAKEAGENFEFVKETSRDLGVNLIESGKGYTKIAAAARGAKMSTEQAQEIFLAAAEASRTFGLNAERTNLVFLAFSQILSKYLLPTPVMVIG